MNLELDTLWIWSAENEALPASFFAGLPHVLSTGDVLVIGSYEFDQNQRAWFDRHSFRDDGTAAENILDSFELNRDEYPGGRYWLFQMEEGLPEALGRQLVDLPRNEAGYSCLDHILAYRKGSPLLPLLRYRHAFRGGCLELSGLYSKSAVKEFGAALRIEFSYVDNPLIAGWRENGLLE